MFRLLSSFMLISILSCFSANHTFAQISFKSLPDFPAFKLQGSDGNTFTSTVAVKKNKPTVIIYFSPTCSHCQTQTEDITGNMKLFKDVQFLFVTSYPAEDYKAFLADYGIEKFANITFGSDPTFAMGRFFELKNIPGVFIYNKEGKLKKFFDTNVKPQKLYSAIFD